MVYLTESLTEICPKRFKAVAVRFSYGLRKERIFLNKYCFDLNLHGNLDCA